MNLKKIKLNLEKPARLLYLSDDDGNSGTLGSAESSETAEKSPLEEETDDSSDSAELARQIETEKITEEGREARTEIGANVGLEQLEKRIEGQPHDRETSREISRMSDESIPETQEEYDTFERYKMALTTLAARAVDSGDLDLSQVANPDDFVAQVEHLYPEFNRTERSAFHKLKAIVENKGAALSRLIYEQWPQFAQSIREKYAEAKKIQENPLMATIAPFQLKGWHIVAGGAMLLGAFGIYKFFSADNKASTDKGSMFGTLAKAGAGIGGLYLLGRLLGGPGKIFEWFKEKLGINMDFGFIEEFIDKIKDAPEKFWNWLTGKQSAESKAEYEKAIEDIKKVMDYDMDPDFLAEIGEKSYLSNIEDDSTGEVFSYFKEQLFGFLPLKGWLEERQKKDRQNLEMLRKYFNTHKKAEIAALKKSQKIKQGTSIKKVFDMLLDKDTAVVEARSNSENIAAERRQAALETLPEGQGKELAREFENEMKNWMFDEEVENFLNTIAADSPQISVSAAAAALTARKIALSNYEKILSQNPDEEKLEDSIEKVLEAESALEQQLEILQHELDKLPPGHTLKKLALLQGPRILGARFLKPKAHLEYGRYLRNKYLFRAPARAAGKIAEKLKPELHEKSAIQSADEKIKKIDQDVKDLKEARKNAVTGIEKTEIANEINGLNNEKKFHDASKKLAEKNQELLSKKAALKTATGAAKATLQAQITALEKQISDLNFNKIKLQGDALLSQAKRLGAHLDEKFAKSSDAILDQKEYRRLDKIGDDFLEYRRNLERIVAEKGAQLEKELEKAAKGLPHNQTLVDTLKKDLQGLFDRQVNMHKGIYLSINEYLDNVWQKAKGIFTDDLPDSTRSKHTKNALDQLREKVLSIYKKQNTDIPKTGKFLKGLGKFKILGFKGGTILNTVQLVIGTKMNYHNKDRDAKKALMKAGGQTAVDLLPITGTISDLYSAATGNEYVTGRELEFSDRLIRLGFGLVGIPCDIASFFGVGLLGRGIIGSLKVGRAASHARKAGKLLDTLKMVGGTLATMGVGLLFKPETLPQSEGFKQVMGDSLQDIEEIEDLPEAA